MYLPKIPKLAKKIFLTSDLFIIGHDFLGHAIWTSWVSKDAEFYVGFTNINLP
jgi:hypothetical protein